MEQTSAQTGRKEQRGLVRPEGEVISRYQPIKCWNCGSTIGWGDVATVPTRYIIIKCLRDRMANWIPV
jgi:hypothetical protein